MPPEPTTARALVRILVERQPVQVDPPGAAAFHAATDALLREIARWVGATGCRALLTRALLRARNDHPALAGIHVGQDTQVRLEGVDQATEMVGAAAVASGLEAVLVGSIELLDRFIGEDMVANLVERSVADGDSDASPADRREASP